MLLARDLGMTVARLRAEMPNDEFVRWTVWYGRRAQVQELAAAKANVKKARRR